MYLKKNGCQKVHLVNGPYNGSSAYLSISGSTSHKRYPTNATKTFTFKVKDQVGQYINGVWKSLDTSLEVHSNITLGYN